MSTPDRQLFTIGYEGKPLEAYVERLKEKGVNVLCDVRKDPVSRKPGFSKRKMEAALNEAGIAYEHLPELGIPKEERKQIQSEADRQELLDRYEREMLPQGEAGLERLEALLEEKGRVALTCYEADPEKCHRLRVLRKLEERAKKAFEPEHL